MMNLLLALLLCLGVTTVQAEIFKCTNEKGKVAFSDKPCSKDAEVVQLTETNIGITKEAPEHSLTMADGSIQPFKKVLSLQVKTKTGYKSGKAGLYVFHNGTDHLIEFDKLVSLKVLDFDRTPCGNSAHLCKPSVLVTTNTTELHTRYEALRNIKILIDDQLVGEEKELVVWFATENNPRIREITF